MKYIWFDINTGEFSNAWDEKEHSDEINSDIFTESNLEEIKGRGVKLIKFECVNDPDFEFYNKMKIISKSKK